MKIKSFSVKGLNRKIDFSFSMYPDVNVLTGLNGSGKTTALKLAWYLVSGNCIRIRNEISFRECSLETDLFKVELEKSGSGDISFYFEDFSSGRTESANFNEPTFHDDEDDNGGYYDGEDLLSDLIRRSSIGSVYFPTFRRIEGGYSITSSKSKSSRNQFPFSTSDEAGLSEALEGLSRKLSSPNHRFVCSISTEDIALLLTERYARMSQDLNQKYADFSSSILSEIKSWEDGSENSASDVLLREIKIKANDIDLFRDGAYKPFGVLADLVRKFFAYQGVKIQTLTLGDAAKSIESGILSAGEKQMLSFLVYNAFAINIPIFIDEPELSLHPDWQRRLLPALLDQQSSNQFIISTHSPFIYSKYSDRELLMNANRGE